VHISSLVVAVGVGVDHREALRAEPHLMFKVS